MRFYQKAKSNSLTYRYSVCVVILFYHTPEQKTIPNCVIARLARAICACLRGTLHRDTKQSISCVIARPAEPVVAICPHRCGTLFCNTERSFCRIIAARQTKIPPRTAVRGRERKTIPRRQRLLRCLGALLKGREASVWRRSQ